MIDTVRKNRRSSAIARDEYPRDRTTALAKGVGKRTEQALLDTLRRTELQIQAIGQISLAEEIISGDVEVAGAQDYGTGRRCSRLRTRQRVAL